MHHRSHDQGGGLCPGVSVQGGLCPGVLCPRGSLSRGSLSREGLCPGGSLSRRVSVQGFSVQGGLCPGGSLSRRVSVQAGLCPGGSLSRRWSLSRGSLSRSFSVRETHHTIISGWYASLLLASLTRDMPFSTTVGNGCITKLTTEKFEFTGGLDF